MRAADLAEGMRVDLEDEPTFLAATQDGCQDCETARSMAQFVYGVVGEIEPQGDDVAITFELSRLLQVLTVPNDYQFTILEDA